MAAGGLPLGSHSPFPGWLDHAQLQDTSNLETSERSAIATVLHNTPKPCRSHCNWRRRYVWPAGGSSRPTCRAHQLCYAEARASMAAGPRLLTGSACTHKCVVLFCAGSYDTCLAGHRWTASAGCGAGMLWCSCPRRGSPCWPTCPASMPPGSGGMPVLLTKALDTIPCLLSRHSQSDAIRDEPIAHVHQVLSVGQMPMRCVRFVAVNPAATFRAIEDVAVAVVNLA